MEIQDERDCSQSSKTFRASRFLLEKTQLPGCVFKSSPLLIPTAWSNADSSSSSNARKLLHSSWTIYKRIASVAKLQVLHCESDSNLSAVKRGSKDVMAQLLAESSFREEVETYIKNEQPRDRLRRIFLPDEITTGVPVQLERLKSSLKLCICGSFAFFFYQGYSQAREEFKTRFATSVFATQSVAQSRRFREMTNAGLRRGFRMTAKMMAFVGPILIMHEALEVYWNKTTPLSLIIPSGTVATLWKISLGPKGMFAGGVIGTAIGTLSGILWYFIAKAGNETQQQLNYRSVENLIRIKRNYAVGRERDYREDVDDLD